MKAFDNEIKSHVKAHMSKIEDENFTSGVVARHLLSKKEKVKKGFFNFEALTFWIVAVLIGIALLTVKLIDETVFFEIQVKHCLILISLTITALIYKWLEKIYSV